MGLDGFSMGNLGLNTNLTSAQLVNQAELSAQKDAEFKIKTISESEEEAQVKRKEHDEEKNNQEFNDGLDEKEENEDNEFLQMLESLEEPENEDTKLTLIDEKDIENSNPKDFSVRINQKTDLVELFSKKDSRVLETIAAKDLMGLVSKLNGASGILVNRKI